MADDELYVVPGRWLKDMERVRRKVDNMTLGGRVEFSNTPTSISGYVRPSPPTTAKAPATEWFWAELTGESDGAYSWKKLVADGGELVESNPLIQDTNHSARELNGKEGLEDGTKVQMWRAGVTGDPPQVQYLFIVGGVTEGKMFPVLVTKTGGDAGDLSEQCSFVYAVYDLDSNLLSYDTSPVWARPAKGKMVPAVRGIAYRHNGDLVLFQVDEVPDLGECPDEEE